MGADEAQKDPVTGLEGRIFTGIFLDKIVDEDEEEERREELSARVYRAYMDALRYAFQAEGAPLELDFEEIDAIPFFDTMMVRRGEGKWEWCDDPNISGIIYGIEAGLMATRKQWLFAPEQSV